MQTMTYDEMKQLGGGDYVCAIAAGGWVAAEASLILAIPTGGWSVVVATVGMGAGLFGMMYGCS